MCLSIFTQDILTALSLAPLCLQFRAPAGSTKAAPQTWHMWSYKYYCLKKIFVFVINTCDPPFTILDIWNDLLTHVLNEDLICQKPFDRGVVWYELQVGAFAWILLGRDDSGTPEKFIGISYTYYSLNSKCTVLCQLYISPILGFEPLFLDAVAHDSPARCVGEI